MPNYPISSGHLDYESLQRIPVVYSKRLLVFFYLATVFAAIANTDYQGEIKSYGNKVIIRERPGNIQSKPYVKGQDLDYDQVEPAFSELLIDHGQYWAFAVDSVDLKQMDLDAIDEWATHAAQLQTIEIDRQILWDIYTQGHARNQGATAGLYSQNINLGAAGSPVEITESNVIKTILRCGQVLDEQSVPQEGRYIVIPPWIATLAKLGLQDASMTGDGQSTLRNGRVGRVDHFSVHVSNQLPYVDDAVAGARCWYPIFGQKYALTFASQMTEQSMFESERTFGKKMRGLQIWGHKVLKPQAFGALYCTDASDD